MKLDPVMVRLVMKALPNFDPDFVIKFWDALVTCPTLSEDARAVGLVMLKFAYAEIGQGLFSDYTVSVIRDLAEVKYVEPARRELVDQEIVFRLGGSRGDETGAVYSFNQYWLEKNAEQLPDWIEAWKEKYQVSDTAR